MGLAFSHTDACWSYSGFGAFRKKLANEIGMELEKMRGFKGGVIPFSEFDDDIIPLLDHSDCDGVLTTEECNRVAPRLRELVSSWPEQDFDKRKALSLADGMEYAFICNQPLEFL